MEKIVIWGASGHAKVIADIIRLRGEYQIAGFLDDINPYRHKTNFCGSQILGGKEQLDDLQELGVHHLIIGFGKCDARLQIGELVKKKGFHLATAIHPNSVIASDVKILPGTVVTAGAIINPGCSIGEHVIINTAASIDHDCRIADGVHICPGVHLAGDVSIGRGTWVGLGACVVEKINIGSFAYIGVGAVVINNIPDGVAAFGNPARVLRENQHLSEKSI